MWFFLRVFTLIFSLQFYILLVSTASLYSPEDALWELDSTNFPRIVYGKSNVWIIEFYNSWCGHCIRFAPTWKIFANEIQNWKNVDVAVINCAESENVKLCRDYEVTGYPTIKLFWANVNDTDKGVPLEGARDVLTMQQSIITYLESNSHRGIPTGWPDLEPLNASSVNEMWDDDAVIADSVYLFLESPDSLVGREVILDLSVQRQLDVRRVLSSNEDFIRSLKLDIADLTFPLILKVGRSNVVEILHRFYKEDNSTFIRDKIFEAVIRRRRINSHIKTSFKSQETTIGNVDSGVHMVDLENALRYSFSQEIAIHSDISGEKLTALKAFISTLKNYFPGKTPIKSYLLKLNNWISHRKGNVEGEEFMNTLEKLQEKDIVLPKMSDWIGCKGSQPRFRGYPCSLWTLFHSLTVQVFDMYEESRSFVKEDAVKVLLAIRGYVTHFFSCKECSEHFQSMSSNLENEVKTPRDVVLWLWDAHNRVNKRLAGDETEDPGHPKIQFPSKDACPKCRIATMATMGDIQWDKGAVLRYLQHFYKKDNILDSNSNEAFPEGKNMRLDDSVSVITFQNVSVLEKWNFRWFTSTDISLCVSLYFVSALLLVVIYILFRQRKKRRRLQFMKFVNIYP